MTILDKLVYKVIHKNHKILWKNQPNLTTLQTITEI